MNEDEKKKFAMEIAAQLASGMLGRDKAPVNSQAAIHAGWAANLRAPEAVAGATELWVLLAKEVFSRMDEAS